MRICEYLTFNIINKNKNMCATFIDMARLAPSLCTSYSTKSDIHGIIMNPQMGGDITVRIKYKNFCQPHILVKKSWSNNTSYNTFHKRT